MASDLGDSMRHRLSPAAASVVNPAYIAQTGLDGPIFRGGKASYSQCQAHKSYWLPASGNRLLTTGYRQLPQYFRDAFQNSPAPSGDADVRLS